MPREGWDGSERYDDGGEPEGPSGILWPGSNRLFTLGAEREGARVSVTMSMARDGGHTEAVPVRERGGTGSEMGRLGASRPAERSRCADQGPAGTALRADDSPGRGPSAVRKSAVESPGRSRRENRRAPPQ
jgi:hypothetical protein